MKSAKATRAAENPITGPLSATTRILEWLYSDRVVSRLLVKSEPISSLRFSSRLMLLSS